MMNRRNFLVGASCGMAGLATGWSAMAEEVAAVFPALPIGGMDAKSAALLAEAGYGYLELSVALWLDPRVDDTTFAGKQAEMRALPLPVRAMNGFLPGDPAYRITGPDASHDKIVEWGKRAFERARATGVEVITFGSGKARTMPAGFEPAKAREQFSQLLGRLAPAAHDAGVVLTIENLNTGETNIGTTLEECLGLVVGSGSPHAKLTFDMFHSLRENEAPAVIEKAASRIVHCHVAENTGRHQPGAHGQDFRPYLNALAKAGYRGKFTFECTWNAPLESAARPAIEAFRAQMRG